MTETDTLTQDHQSLSDTMVTRRYFSKFARITGHLARVAGQMEAEGGRMGREEVEVLARYLVGLGFTFRALANKHFWSGRGGEGHGSLTFDRHESGFPVHAELLQMAADAAQAGKHLAGMPSAAELKSQMVQTIVGELTIPTRLQYALSQRLYYEELQKGDLFWPQNHPDVIWLGNNGHQGRDARRRYLVHWAVYDSRQNIPTIYLMEVEDTGRTALPKDERRWPQAQSHLMAQAMAGLKLVTIASGFDRDFDDLHPPKSLKRIHVGPMYSHTFTRQTGRCARCWNRRSLRPARTGRWPGRSRNWKASGSRWKNPAGSARSNAKFSRWTPPLRAAVRILVPRGWNARSSCRSAPPIRCWRKRTHRGGFAMCASSW